MRMAQVFLYRQTPRGALFTYAVPEQLVDKVVVGAVVEVPFGRFAMHGIVWGFEEGKTYEFVVKAISRLVFDDVVLLPHLKDTIEWVSSYYHAPLVSVVKTVLPPFLLKLPKRERKDVAVARSLESGRAVLTQKQDGVLKEILQGGQKSFLLHGVTGAGKTEVYLHAVVEMLEQGKQVIMLVPEISLTPQMIGRFKRFFPDEEIAIWHSELSPGEKYRLWHKMRSGVIRIVVGSRSAIFSPFSNLGLIVIDEEHDGAYKQDNNPRYDARMVAEHFAKLTGCLLLCGSATPSVERYYRARKGEIGLLQLTDRVIDATAKQQQQLFAESYLPEVGIVDLRKEPQVIFSRKLQEAITATLEDKKIAFLFLNRRGFSPYLFCTDCGKVVECRDCALPFIYHRKASGPILLCHHCGLVAKPVTACPSCKSSRVQYGGVGTQKVEGEVQALWPDARVFRMDKDSMGKKGSFEEVYKLLLARKIDILIGTQMMTKGWDIPGVALIGVVSADVGLHLPDFRAGERTFQLLAQVAGRAGRRGEKSTVLCQTYVPENEYVAAASEHDYVGFFNYEIQLREDFGYPPFGRMVRLVYEDEDEGKAEREALRLAGVLKAVIEKESLALQEPIAVPCFLSKIRTKFRWEIVLQGEAFDTILKVVEGEWKVDVDPVSMM